VALGQQAARAQQPGERIADHLLVVDEIDHRQAET
jgi:hypothetical protein